VVCEDETTPASEEMLEWAIEGSELHVPALWTWEILNVVAVTVKRGRITGDRAREFLAQLATLNFRIASPPLPKVSKSWADSPTGRHPPARPTSP